MMSRQGVRGVLLVVLAGCGGGGGGECDAPRTPTPLDRSSAGAITGRVTFTGTPPLMAPLKMSGECAAQHQGLILAGDALVRDGRVENAFVYVKDGLGDRIFAVPEEPVVIDQVGCLYRPHVGGAQTCQPITFRNSDGLLHNVHGTPTRAARAPCASRGPRSPSKCAATSIPGCGPTWGCSATPTSP